MNELREPSGNSTLQAYFVLLVTAAIIAAACSGKPEITASASTSPVASPSASPTATPTPTPTSTPPAFEVVITSKYESGDQTATTEADCKIAAGTATYGAAVACTNTLGAPTTSVAIPEGRLFFSALTWTINVGSVSGVPVCDRVIFRPYYYVPKTQGTAFSAPWIAAGTTVDCTKSPTPANCFGGAAPVIISGFPNYTSSYSKVTTDQATASWSLQSANSRSYGSNRASVNNLSAAERIGVGFDFTLHASDGFAGGASNFKDYVFECVDQWNQPVYSMTLIITDQDITGVYPNASQSDSTINQFTDWDSAAWDR